MKRLVPFLPLLTACADLPAVAEPTSGSRLSPMRLDQPLVAFTAPVQEVELEHAGAAKDAPEPREVEPALLESCTEGRAIVIFKAARTLELRCGDAVAGRYAISLGFAPAHHKLMEGDGRTPEGDYFITHKFVSQFHRSLQVAYPNARDAARGLAEGTITRRQHDAIVSAVSNCRLPPQNTMLGSHIQIHGAGGGAWAGDWTLGCVALDNDPIEAVFAFHERGCNADGSPKTPIRIRP